MSSSARDANSVTVCGIHAVSALLRENRILRLYMIDGGGARLRDLAARAAAAGVPVTRQPRPALTRRAQEEHHQGVVGDARLPRGDLPALIAAEAPLIVLDGVTDPRNLGALLRAARAFGAAAVITAERRSAPLTAAAVRAAAGAAASIPVARAPNIARVLRRMDAAGRVIIGAAEDAGDSLFSRPLPPAPCWVLGDEGGGLRRLTREHCHYLLRIPTVGGDAGCLNVAVAAAVCLAAAAAPAAQPSSPA